MMKQIWFTQSDVRAYAPCSKQFGSCFKRQMMRTVRDSTKVCALPHNKAVNLNAFVPCNDCKAQSLQGHRSARRFPPSVIAQKRLVSATLYGHGWIEKLTNAYSQGNF